MALLRIIFDRNIHWRRNNNPYVEPTDGQKLILEQKAEDRRKRIMKSKMELAAMFGTIEAWCPGVIDRYMKLAELSK